MGGLSIAYWYYRKGSPASYMGILSAVLTGVLLYHSRGYEHYYMILCTYVPLYVYMLSESVSYTHLILLNYRTHKKQVSSKLGNTQFANADRIRERQLKRLGVALDEKMRKVYTSWVKEEKDVKAETFCQAQKLIQEFCRANKEKNIYDNKLMEKTLKEMLFMWVLRNKSMEVMIKLPVICDSIGDLPIVIGQSLEIVKRKVHGE